LTDLDLHILRCKPIIENDEKGEEILKLAGIFQGIDCIYFLPVPKYAFRFVEHHIELTIEHELIHLIIYKLEGENCTTYDRLFPHVNNLEEFRK